MSRNMDPMKMPAAYWAECIEDEKELAPLLGWARLNMPDQVVENAWIFGSNHAEFTSLFGPQVTSDGIKPLPRWRRDASAMGLLLDKVPANIRWDEVMQAVHVWIGQAEDPLVICAQRYADHPSDGHALRKALVRLAIAYLAARRMDARAFIADLGQPQEQ